MRTHARNLILSLIVLLLVGCVGGGGGSNGGIGGGGSGGGGVGSSGSFPGYVILDLVSGFTVTVNSLGDLDTNPAYRNDFMVFRRIPTGTMTKGTRNGVMGGTFNDELPSGATVGGFYLGVFEVTQAQWQRLRETRPWTFVSPGSVIGDNGTVGSRPATGVDRAEINLALADNANLRLRLPTNNEWEYAARAGSDCLFSWGDNAMPSAASPFAVLWETTGGAFGAASVGSRQANPFGVYDMAGNVWEWTEEGQLRGGSWSDNVFIARCANKVRLSEGIDHGTVGLRLVYQP